MAMTDEEINALLGEPSAPASQTPPPSDPSAAGGETPQESATSEFSDDEINALLGDEKLVDDLTAEPILPAVNGSSLNSPANDPVLGLIDRTMLSFGNEAGKLEYLKTKFEDAAINDRGYLVVKKDGRWNYADPMGYGQRDAWKVTEEVLADMADEAGNVIVAALAIGGGTAGSIVPGAGTAAGGVSGALAGAYLKTSLGRLAGTYSATPMEQVRDMSVEGLFQLAGEKFLPGVRWGTSKMASAVSKLGKTLKAKEGAQTLGRFFSRFSVGEKAMQTIMDNGDEVAALMKNTKRSAGSDTGRYIEAIQSDMEEHIMGIAKKSDDVLGATYRQFRQKIIDAVPDNFEYNVRSTALKGYKKSIEEGYVDLIQKGKKITNPEAIAQYLTTIEKTGRMPKGVKFTLKSQSEIKTLLKRSGSFDNEAIELVTDNDAYRMLKEMHEVLDLGIMSKQAKGKAAATQMMDFKKRLGNTTYKLATAANDAGLNGMQRAFTTYGNIVDADVAKSLNSVGNGGLYSQMNQNYSALKDTLIPLSHAHKRYVRGAGTQPFSTLANKLLSKPGKGTPAKNSLKALVDAAGSLEDKSTLRFLENEMKALDIADAAMAFNPYVTRTGASGAGILGYGVMTGNWGLIGAVATKTGLESTQITKAGVRGTQNMWKGLQYLKANPNVTKEMVNSSVAASAFANSLIDATQIGQETQEMLESQLPPIPMREQ